MYHSRLQSHSSLTRAEAIKAFMDRQKVAQLFYIFPELRTSPYPWIKTQSSADDEPWHDNQRTPTGISKTIAHGGHVAAWDGLRNLFLSDDNPHHTFRLIWFTPLTLLVCSRDMPSRVQHCGINFHPCGIIAISHGSCYHLNSPSPGSLSLRFIISAGTVFRLAANIPPWGDGVAEIGNPRLSNGDIKLCSPPKMTTSQPDILDWTLYRWRRGWCWAKGIGMVPSRSQPMEVEEIKVKGSKWQYFSLPRPPAWDRASYSLVLI